MTTKGKRPLRHLTASDKIDAIQRIHDGESKASVARDIGVPESTLRGWCKNEDKLRFMSRQSAPDKMGSDSLADKLADGAAAAAAAVSLLAGPPEKRQKLDSGLPLNFSNKIKYEDLAYKRSPLNGLDFSTNKALSDLSFNGLAQDYSAFPKSDMSALNGSCKTKGYGADLSKQNDPSKTDLSMAAISPLTSLSHLSGMTGLAQSPLALSFNEIASNLNLIAQLNNPNLAAMTGLNGLSTPGGIVGAGGGGGGGNSIRNLKPKPPAHSPRSENDKPQGLSVKNWAKCQQKNSNDSFGMNLSDCKPKLKSSAQQLSRDAPVDDALWYWLKSQQTMLGLNNLYTSIPSSSPIRSSTPQQQVPHHNHSTSTPPIGSTPQTPSSTPSGSSEDTKNSSWFWQWYKTFGANFMGDKQQPPISHSLLNHSNGLNGSVSSTHNSLLNSNSSLLNNHHNNNNNNNDNIANNNTIDMSKPPFDNILYSHLTKDAIMNVDNLNNNETNNNNINTDTINNNITNKPEDLSAKPSVKEELTDKDVVKSEADTNSTNAKETLDNTSFSPIANNNHHIDSSMSNNSHEHNNTTNMNMNTSSSHINSSGSCGGDEAKSEECDSDDVCGPQEALEHGEKFLKWLESYSDPRVTAMQVMQFKYLLNGIRSGAEQTVSSESDRTRIRRRK